jgi:putative transcriptional regulator
MAIRARLKALIAERNLERINAGEAEMSLRSVARDAGLSVPAISALVNNKTHRIDYTTLDKLCRFFGCTPGDILIYVPEPTPEPATNGRDQ